MKKIRPMNGTVIIQVKNTMDDITPSGIYKDISFNKHGKVMISAQVIEVSGSGDNEIMFELERGDPRSRFEEAVYKYNRQVKHNIKIGDWIFFHYLVLEAQENFLWLDEDWKIYKLLISDVFLSLRKHTGGGYWSNGIEYRAIMHNEYVLGTPYYGEGWETLEVDDKVIAGKIDKKTGLVTELKGEPNKNMAVITDIGRGIQPYSRHKEIKPGFVCFLTPKCEFENEIAGQKRWVFKHSDIIAYKKHDSVIPAGDYVLIKLKDRSYDGALEVDLEKFDLEDEGTVVSAGALVDNEVLDPGTVVKFSKRRAYDVLDKKFMLVREINIMGLIINEFY